MFNFKTLLYRLPVGIALTLELAIAPGIASPPSPRFSTSPLSGPSASLVPFFKDHAERQVSDRNAVTEIRERKKPSITNMNGEQLAQSNPPPPPTNPSSSSAGGRRDPSNCPQDTATPSPLLTALSPTTKPGFTSAEHPTFLVYVPKTSAKNAEFSLRSRGGQGIYRTTIALTKTPNLISITLPAQAPPLTVGKPYSWFFAVICNPNDRVDDRFVMGTVQRIALDPARLRQIQQASINEQIVLYQKADIWYDALALLFQLKRSQPNRPDISSVWRELLQAGGVDSMIDSNAEKANPR